METSIEMANSAIEAAANFLILKIEKHHRKHIKEEKTTEQRYCEYIRLPRECQCEKQKLEVFEGKNSPLITSLIANRKVLRRDAVAERCEVESTLLRESLTNIKKTNNMVEMNLY